MTSGFQDRADALVSVDLSIVAHPGLEPGQSLILSQVAVPIRMRQ